MTHHPELDSPQELAAAYALGALGPEEARAFEAYLARSAEAQREVAEYGEVAALLGLGVAEGGPDSALRDRVLARVEAEKVRPLRPERRGGRPATLLWGALAASLLATVGLGAAALSLRRDRSALAAALQERSRLLATTQAELAERDSTLSTIFGPGVELVQLTATGDPEPGIQLFWNRARNLALLQAYGLKPVPPGQAYQLWFLQDGKPVPSITFKPEPEGGVRVERVLLPSGSAEAAAVTIEPEAGSAQPTTPIVLLGSLTRS